MTCEISTSGMQVFDSCVYMFFTLDSNFYLVTLRTEAKSKRLTRVAELSPAHHCSVLSARWASRLPATFGWKALRE